MLKFNHNYRALVKAQGFTLRTARVLMPAGESLFWSRSGYWPLLAEQLGFNSERAQYNPQQPRRAGALCAPTRAPRAPARGAGAEPAPLAAPRP